MIALAPLRIRMMSVTSDARDEGGAPGSGSMASAVLEALNWLDYGALLVDAGGHVHFANAKAHELRLSRRLCVQGGQLRAQTISETTDLHQLVARCARAGRRAEAGDQVAHCRVGDLLLQLAPLSTAVSAMIEQPLVAVFIVDLGGTVDPTPEQVRLHFPLTAAEAAFACEIVKGDGLIACARKFGISESTARTHLRRILDKTGTKRQAQLVRTLLALRSIIRQPIIRKARNRSLEGLCRGE